MRTTRRATRQRATPPEKHVHSGRDGSDAMHASPHDMSSDWPAQVWASSGVVFALLFAVELTFADLLATSWYPDPRRRGDL